MAKKFDYLEHMGKTMRLGAIESVGWGLPFQIAAGTPDVLGSRAVATRAAVTGSRLAGVPTLTYSAVGLVKSLDMLKGL